MFAKVPNGEESFPGGVVVVEVVTVLRLVLVNEMFRTRGRTDGEADFGFPIASSGRGSPSAVVRERHVRRMFAQIPRVVTTAKDILLLVHCSVRDWCSRLLSLAQKVGISEGPTCPEGGRSMRHLHCE